MKCPFCGRYSEVQICPFCGLDYRLESKIRHTADRFYRQGYAAATDHDLYRAKQLLKKAQFYNGRDIRVMNLLGLVHYRVGDINEAILLWEKSVVTDSRSENRAHGYLSDLESNETRLRAMQEAVRLYDDALEQSRNGNLDYAVARLRKAVGLNRNYVKAQLLLSLLYINMRHYRRAMVCLDRVEKVDKLHPLVFRYRRIITELQQAGEADAEDTDVVQDVSDRISVRAGMREPDLLEVFGTKKNKKIRLHNWHQTASQILLFAIGCLCTAVFIYTLKIPDDLRALQDEVESLETANSALEDSQDELEKDLLSAQQDVYNAELSAADLETENEELTAQIEELTGVTTDDALAQAATSYIEGDYMATAIYLVAVASDELEDESLILYETLNDAATDLAEDIYELALEAYSNKEDEEDEDEEDSSSEDSSSEDSSSDEEEEETVSYTYTELKAAFQYCGEVLTSKTSTYYRTWYYYAVCAYEAGDYEDTITATEKLMEEYTSSGGFLTRVETLNEQAQEALS